MSIPQIPNELRHQMVALGQVRTCLNCARFTSVEDNYDVDAAICSLAGRIPPATVIFYGCESWLDLMHDVPF